MADMMLQAQPVDVGQMMTELCSLDACSIVRKIHAKEISPVEVVEAALARIERLNPKVNAVCTVAADSARKAARTAEQLVISGGKLGPLHGIPVGIKDVTPTAGIRTTYGSRLYADHVPDHDAEIVRRLKAMGAIVIGKTNTPEFAAGANTFNEVFGATRNPWNVKLSAGGSTGGCAAGLAAGMFPLAEGTDFGGSLRVPAAFCRSGWSPSDAGINTTISERVALGHTARLRTYGAYGRRCGSHA